jgi:hypothetical protein
MNITIDIEAMDHGDFTDIALLVDNECFREEVGDMREKYGKEYKLPLSEEDTIYFLHKRQFDVKFKKEFDADIERIRKQFNRPPHFTPVIEFAIIYGVITKGVYAKAYLEEQIITPIEDPGEIPDIKYCIVIHAGTRKPDVERAFKKFEEKVRINFRANEEEKTNYNFGYWADLSLQRMRDTSSSIEILHKWHARTLKGEKPIDITLDKIGLTHQEYIDLKKRIKTLSRKEELEILEPENKKLDRIYKQRDSIKEQLRQYRKLLKTANS